MKCQKKIKASLVSTAKLTVGGFKGWTKHENKGCGDSEEDKESDKI